MKLRKWTLGLFSALLLAVALLSGCGSSNSDNQAGEAGSSDGQGKTKPKIVIYDWGNSDSILYKIAEDIAAENNTRPDSTVKMEVQHISGSETYYPKLNAGLAANNGPSIFVSHAAGKLQTYADSGRALDLTDILNKDEAWKSSFTSGGLNLLTFNDKIYAVPTAFATVPLFYNKEIFGKYNLQPPQTYEELKNVVRVLKDNNITPFAFGAKDSWTSALFSEVIANRIGGNGPFDAIMNGEGTWMDSSYIETGKVLVELRDLGAYPEGFLGLDNTAMTNMFKNGEAAMFVTGSWAIGNIVTEDSKVKDKVGIAKFPAFPNGKGDIDTWLGQPSYNLVISASEENKDAAVEYLKAWTSEKIQKRLAEENGDIPATKVKLDPDKVPALSQELQQQMSTMKGMFIFYDVGLGAKIGDEYNATIQAILAGESPENAFRNLEQFTKDSRS